MTQTKEPSRLQPLALEKTKQCMPVQTEDGSWTLYDPLLDVHYRSMQGAHSESKYVFLEGTGMLQRPAPWTIIEMGLGGGVNFLQTAQHFVEQTTSGILQYHAIEYAPIDPALLETPGYADWALEEHVQLLQRALTSARQAILQRQETQRTVTTYDSTHSIELYIYPSPWEDADLQDVHAQAVFHDPFGPRTNPEAWTTDCFHWLWKHMQEDGILATYGAASHARRAMVEAGFYIAKAPGNGRKREMTLASPTPSPLERFKQIPRSKYVREI